MKILCVLSHYNYGVPERGLGYEYANFIPALRSLGHQVTFVDLRDRSVFRDFADLNRHVLECVRDIMPEIVFFVVTYYEIWRETLETIRKSGISITINWSTDDSWRYAQLSAHLADAFDIYVTTFYPSLARYHSKGIATALMSQWGACSDNLIEPKKSRDCIYDVTFVGSAHGTRRKLVESIRRKGINLRCFGFGWECGSVSADDIPKIINNSRISLNFANAPKTLGWLSVRSINQIKARTFEVPGAGGFLLTQPASGLDMYYVIPSEINVFYSIEDLVNKIKFFRTSEDRRDEVALAGYRRTRLNHTYEMRFKNIIEKASELLVLRRGAFRGAIDFTHFDKLIAQHRRRVPGSTIVAPASRVASFILGNRRGPRAIRRLSYEISWRLCGKSTYSYAGVPGRLFFKES
jgi:spore maturation protein CgeB